MQIKEILIPLIGLALINAEDIIPEGVAPGPSLDLCRRSPPETEDFQIMTVWRS